MAVSGASELGRCEKPPKFGNRDPLTSHAPPQGRPPSVKTGLRSFWKFSYISGHAAAALTTLETSWQGKKSIMHRRGFIKKGLQVGWGPSTSAALASSTDAGAQILAAAGGSTGGDSESEVFWARVRDQFPLTREIIYVNNGGLGPSPRVSIQAIHDRIDELEETSETGHSAKLWSSVKEKAGRVLGCRPEEIAYTRNTTEGVNIVCNGLPLKTGDEVITSTHEHVGNTISWLARQKRDGIRIRVFEPSTASAQENIDRIESLINPRTRVISISHVTTATGQVLPVGEIGELAAQHDLWYFIDGAQSAGMMPVDVTGMGCHAYATSGHKWLLGPKGTGLLYVRESALESIEARFVGAYSNAGHTDMATGEFGFHPTAQRYEYGTVNIPLFLGLGESIGFLLDLGLETVKRRNHALAAALMTGLDELGAQVLSPRNTGEHSSIVTFKIKEMPKDELQQFLSKHYRIRSRGIYEGGLEALRISLHIYNSFDEVSQILEGVRAAQAA